MMMRTIFTFICFIALLSSCSNSKEPSKLFELKTESTRITFSNDLHYTEDFNPYTYRNFYNGGGVALADINNDGFTDIYFTGNLVNNQLYLNNGDWTFENITDTAGVACIGNWSTGATFADVNNDGWLDLYVCKSGKPGGENRNNQLFINNGNNTFTDQSKAYGLDITGLSVHAAFFDYDKDGDLDCYVLNNSIKSVGGYDLIKDQRNIPSKNGNKLLRNDNGKFIDVTSDAGIYSSAIGFGLGITLGDYNNDTWPDLFISNDFFEKDYLYINNTIGGFTEQSDTYFQSLSLGSMGADTGDLNNDLRTDIMVTEMLPTTIARKRTKALFESWNKATLATKKGYHKQFPRNVLQRNNKGSFQEIGRKAGVSATEWSWASLLFDMDNDGLRDIYVSNGIAKDLLDRDYLTYQANDEKVRNMMKTEEEVIMKLIDLMPSKPIVNSVFKNKGDFNFEAKENDWGLTTPSFSNGSAYADLDNDGDLDVVVNNINAAPFVYENHAEKAQVNSISFKLKGITNTEAIGAKAKIYYGNGQQSMLENFPSRGFQSSITSTLHFGLGTINMVDSLVLLWPNNKISKAYQLAANQNYVFNEPQTATENQISKTDTAETQITKAQTAPFSFTHKENTFVDFNREQLLPEMFSNEGPATAVADINNDSIDDMYVGGAKYQSGKLFVSSNKGYQPTSSAFEIDKNAEDTAALFFDADQDGDMDLFVCSGGKAYSKFDSALNDRLYINHGNGNFTKQKHAFSFPTISSSGSVTAADYDNDGDIDLFVGERFKTTTYGISTGGILWNNQGNGTFLPITSEAFNVNGMITDVAFTDMDGDKRPDLVIAGEWMPITILKNTAEGFVKASSTTGLQQYAGMWKALKVKDIDGDGDMDIIAANTGENGLYQPNMKLFVHDFDGNGTMEQLLCTKEDNRFYPIADRDELIAQLPKLKSKLLYYKDYATADIETLFPETILNKATTATITETKTSLFINDNGVFTPISLPNEAQYSSMYAIEVLDANDDGILDIILGGNQYMIKPQFGQQDASEGWLLLGDKTTNTYQIKNIVPLEITGQIRSFNTLKTKEKKYLVSTINNAQIQFHELH